MTPKQKAEKLIQNYRSVNFTTGNNSKMIASYIDCKKCALIAVDEIIYILTQDINPLINYWFEVRQEIVKYEN
jgi:hypothetical protein